MITQTKLARRLYSNGTFTGKYKEPVGREGYTAICPCHGQEIIVLASKGQVINLHKECKRQKKLSTVD